MSGLTLSRGQVAAAIAILVGVGAVVGAGAVLLRPDPEAPKGAVKSDRKVLYWYDPMVPGQKFDTPGKSPFMDMQLVPRYADEAQGEPGVRIDPARMQALGSRIVTVEQGVLENEVSVPGILEFNGRDVAIVQARTSGFVQSAPQRAPGDIVPAGAALATILVPEWSGAQTEFLAVRRTGDAQLTSAARQRLGQLGMPPAVIAAVEQSGRPQATTTVTVPSGGVIRSLAVRNGMTVTQGQTLAEINGIATLWLNAAVPEVLAGQIKPGQMAEVSFAAYPGERFSGRVSAILPETAAESRTLTARVELASRGRLRPGMYGQATFKGGGTPALLVPSEAVIRTGRRTLVMVALADGRFRPAEVQVGREGRDRTEVLAGLAAGERIVASGQFLIDSEASLSGLEARPIGPQGAVGMATPAASHQSRGRIERLAGRAITLSHEPVPALQWPAMTMTFTLADPSSAQGLRVGDRVHFTFDQQGGTPTVRHLTKVAP